jgi:hypothetical protein
MVRLLFYLDGGRWGWRTYDGWLAFDAGPHALVAHPWVWVTASLALGVIVGAVVW